MSLKLYNSEQNEINNLSDYIDTYHNGFTGGDYQVQLFLKADNVDLIKYINISIEPILLDIGELVFHPSGWSMKLCYSSEQPSEKEWNESPINDVLTIPDITDTNYKSFWLRVYCPGYTKAIVQDNLLSFNLNYQIQAIQ